MAESNVPNFALSSLYVADLNPNTDETTLLNIFSNIGPILSIRINRDADQAFAYVNFENAKDAETALNTMNFDLIDGRNIRIMWSQNDLLSRKMGIGNVLVRNLDSSIDENVLHKIFSVYGTIICCQVARHDDDALKMDHGYVHYLDKESADMAVEKTNGKIYFGKKLQVEHVNYDANNDDLVIDEGTEKNNNPLIDFNQSPIKTTTIKENENNEPCYVYVANLSPDITDNILTAMFSPFGKILSTRIMMSKSSSTAYAFLSFSSEAEAIQAVNAINGKKMLKRFLNVRLINPINVNKKNTSRSNKNVSLLNVDEPLNIQSKESLNGANLQNDKSSFNKNFVNEKSLLEFNEPLFATAESAINDSKLLDMVQFSQKDTFSQIPPESLSASAPSNYSYKNSDSFELNNLNSSRSPGNLCSTPNWADSTSMVPKTSKSYKSPEILSKHPLLKESPGYNINKKITTEPLFNIPSKTSFINDFSAKLNKQVESMTEMDKVMKGKLLPTELPSAISNSNTPLWKNGKSTPIVPKFDLESTELLPSAKAPILNSTDNLLINSSHKPSILDSVINSNNKNQSLLSNQPSIDNQDVEKLFKSLSTTPLCPVGPNSNENMWSSLIDSTATLNAENIYERKQNRASLHTSPQLISTEDLKLMSKQQLSVEHLFLQIKNIYFDLGSQITNMHQFLMNNDMPSECDTLLRNKVEIAFDVLKLHKEKVEEISDMLKKNYYK